MEISTIMRKSSRFMEEVDIIDQGLDADRVAASAAGLCALKRVIACLMDCLGAWRIYAAWGAANIAARTCAISIIKCGNVDIDFLKRI